MLRLTSRRVLFVQMDADTGNIIGTIPAKDAFLRVPFRVLHKAKRGKDFDGNCPNCGMLVHGFWNSNYCGLCGQALRWNDD